MGEKQEIAVMLLEECVRYGEMGAKSLDNWFINEVDLIKRIIREISEEAEGDKKMKLIIQIDEDGDKYAYMENEKHHEIVEQKSVESGGRKGLKRLDADLLNQECDLDCYEPGYFVFDIG